jgi:Flp pilus assembly secretin CpaC
MKQELAAFGRRLAVGTLVATALLALPRAAAAEGLIDLTIDFAKVVRLDGPATTIVIGNPGIADAAVEDEQTLVLTGKAAGTTNLIVLDENGEPIVDSVLRVSSNVQQLTTIFYGGERQTFSCAPTCEQVISVGDEPTAFENATTQIQTRQQFANGQ